MAAMNAFRFLAALLLAAGFTGCETAPPVDPASMVQRSLTFPQPAAAAGGKGKWRPVPRDGGAEYVQASGSLEDVVSFYGFYADVAPEVKSFDDMEALLRSDSSFNFLSLERGEVNGVPVLWFEKRAVEKGAGSAKLAGYLGVNQRRASGEYTVRTHGVFMFQPGAQPRFVTIACARTSESGQIGPAYLSQFQSWLSGIVISSFL